MPNSISPELLAEMFKQQSGDCFLTLLTLNHASFDNPVRLVNNTEDITSRGNLFSAFPFKIVLPVEDGESAREVAIELDNVSLEIINNLRQVTDPIDVTLEMILGSIPNDVQVSLEELKIGSISYDEFKITAKMYQDNFMSSGLTSERYHPTNFPGLF